MSETQSESSLFPILDDHYLEDLKACGKVLKVNTGELLYREGDAEYCFYVVLSGQIKITKRLGTEEIFVAAHRRGEFTGDLNMLSGAASQATAYSTEPSQVIQFQDFKELLKSCPSSIDLFIPALAERSKYLEVKLRQQEKLAELGKLSASLAHELNNPAAAGNRAAKQLHSAIATLQENMLSPRGQQFSAQHRQLLCQLQHKAVHREYYKTELSPLEESLQEEELADWLESLGVDDAWDISPSLVSVGIEQSHLEPLAAVMESATFNEALQWLEASLTVNDLVTELELSTSQISDLVGAIKSHSYVDRGAIQEINLHQGLDNSLKILHHKLKYGVTVNREYSSEVPQVSAYPGELNQVWTNLIDNAIDAMNGQGELTIRTSLENNCVLIEIIDNGAGIPESIKPQIFDAFFTSKAAGKGSGLGLDISRGIIVKKHKGKISFMSKPGRTNFQVRIPIKQ
ncbi:MAG: ATP-binding protein [Cyanobacteria bacterium J06621_8]